METDAGQYGENIPVEMQSRKQNKPASQRSPPGIQNRSIRYTQEPGTSKHEDEPMENENEIQIEIETEKGAEPPSPTTLSAKIKPTILNRQSEWLLWSDRVLTCFQVRQCWTSI